MRMRQILFTSALAALLTLGATVPCISLAADKQKHYFMVLSNPLPGQEARFNEWYAGQHTHDLLQIEGVVAAQFFKLSEPQYREGQPHPYNYMVIWEIESDNVKEVYQRIQQNLANGKTMRSDSFAPVSGNDTFTPVTRRLTQEEVKGKSVAEVLKMSTSPK